MADSAKRKPAPASVREIRVGVPQNYYFTQVAPEVREAVHNAAKRAEGLGARVIPVQVPDIDAISAASLVILLSEAAALYEPYLNRQSEIGVDVLRRCFYQGRLVPATDYVNAQRLRKGAGQRIPRALSLHRLPVYSGHPHYRRRASGSGMWRIDGETLDTRLVTDAVRARV